MAHLGEVGVVCHAVDVEPPTAEHGCDEGCDEAADVDEHVEYLESGIALRAVAWIVVELSDDGLEVAFEEAVAEGDEEECGTCEGEEPCGVLRRGEDGHGEDGVACCHYDEAVDDGAFVVLCLVGYGAAYEAEDVDTGIEKRVDQRGCVAREPEFGAEEEHEHGVHDVIAEALAHIAQCCGNEAFWMVFKHKVIVSVLLVLS